MHLVAAPVVFDLIFAPWIAGGWRWHSIRTDLRTGAVPTQAPEQVNKETWKDPAEILGAEQHAAAQDESSHVMRVDDVAENTVAD
jgi:hypothetical protein